MRGAWLHLLTDALGSVGVIVAGAAIWAFGWRWADPVASIVISALVLASAWGLLRDAVDILMEAAPRHLDIEAIRKALDDLPETLEVHDLHVWTIGNGEIALSSHLIAPPTVQSARLLSEITSLLRQHFGIAHTTIQIESGDPADPTCSTNCN